MVVHIRSKLYHLCYVEERDEAGSLRDKDPETAEKCGENSYPFFIFIQF